MRVLITGITGFVGSHMAEYAIARGARVFGCTRGRRRAENIESLLPRLDLVQCDLLDAPDVRHLLEQCAPTHVVHLAAQSSAGDSWQAPAETLTTNVVGQVNLLEAVRTLDAPPRVLCVGSSDEYGQVEEDELPVRETNPLRPLSPYAVSKVAQDLMGYQYWRSYGVPIVRARAFGHDGPRRGEAYVTSSVARQIAEIEVGRRSQTAPRPFRRPGHRARLLAALGTG
jgi:GDP-4-dehydro-6-deoxy-D-mannose reductase